MLFFSFFKTLVNHEVTVELKNDISIRGTLKSVDQYLNIKLDDISVVEEMKYPHLVGLETNHLNCISWFGGWADGTGYDVCAANVDTVRGGIKDDQR